MEIPGANGQGETKEECLSDLKAAVKLLLETERELAFKEDPAAEEVSIAV